jgi:hypothetical protein
MLDVMPSQKWRLALFGLAFFSVLLLPGVAGPMPKPLHFKICIPQEHPITFPNPFLRSVQLPPPISMFQLDGVNLTHVAAPPEFRAHDPRTTNARETLHTQPWPPPCPPVALSSMAETIGGQ